MAPTMPRKEPQIMSFEQWWGKNHVPGEPMDAKKIWDAATALEREACALLCLTERDSAYYSRHPSIKNWKLVGLWQAHDAITNRTKTV